jgi:hypothetical protein
VSLALRDVIPGTYYKFFSSLPLVRISMIGKGKMGQADLISPSGNGRKSLAFRRSLNVDPTLAFKQP